METMSLSTNSLSQHPLGAGRFWSRSGRSLRRPFILRWKRTSRKDQLSKPLPSLPLQLETVVKPLQTDGPPFRLESSNPNRSHDERETKIRKLLHEMQESEELRMAQAKDFVPYHHSVHRVRGLPPYPVQRPGFSPGTSHRAAFAPQFINTVQDNVSRHGTGIPYRAYRRSMALASSTRVHELDVTNSMIQRSSSTNSALVRTAAPDSLSMQNTYVHGNSLTRYANELPSNEDITNMHGYSKTPPLYSTSVQSHPQMQLILSNDSRRSSGSTLVELDAWPTKTISELPEISSSRDDRIQKPHIYGDKRFRTLPGEACPLMF